jgi:hypothetical protein
MISDLDIRRAAIMLIRRMAPTPSLKLPACKISCPTAAMTRSSKCGSESGGRSRRYERPREASRIEVVACPGGEVAAITDLPSLFPVRVGSTRSRHTARRTKLR